MKVEVYEGPDRAWDEFVRRHDGWTHMHLIGWRRVVRSVFGHESPYLAAVSDGDIRGILPLVAIRSRLFGRFLVSMPFLNYGGPLGDDDAISLLVEGAVDRARAGKADLLELRSRRELDIPLPDSGRKITVTLPLTPGDPDAVWGGFSSKFRNKLRRASRDGVEIRFGAEHVAPFHEVFRRHMRDLGTPTLPESLFQTIAETFPDSSWFVCAYLEDRPIAAGCALTWGDEIEMTWSAALREHSHIRPNSLLYWTVMERACREGLRTFNFGRCSPGSGTHQFKRSWEGSVDEPLHWYFWSPHGRSATPAPSDSKYSWGPRIWRRLPVPVASTVGPSISRLIP